MRVIFGSIAISFLLVAGSAAAIRKMGSWSFNEDAVIKGIALRYIQFGLPYGMALETAKCAAPAIANMADRLNCTLDTSSPIGSIDQCAEENPGFNMIALAIGNACWQQISSKMFEEVLGK